MACDAKTLANAIAINHYSGLSDYDLLVCIAYVLGVNAGVSNAQAAVNAAAAAGYAKLSDGDLSKLLTSTLCR